MFLILNFTIRKNIHCERNLIQPFICVIFLFLSECPQIMTRNRWAGRPPRDPTLQVPLNSPEYVVIHHTTGRFCVSHASCAGLVRSIQSAHFFHKKYNDIGYHFLIGGNGFIYEGRGWKTETELNKNYNSRILSIAFIGTYDNVLPDIRALQALRALIICGLTENHLPRSFTYIGHRQIAPDTSCPGVAFLRYMVTWPKFNPNPRIADNSTLV